MTTKSNHPDQQVPIAGLPGAFVTKDSIAVYEVLEELQRIRARYGPLASTHEGLGVLLEEFEELKDEIKKSANSFRSDLMRHEAIQVAAVATRIASDLAHDDSKVRPRTVLLRDQAAEQCGRMRDRALEAERDLKELQRVSTLFVLTRSTEHAADLMGILGVVPSAEVSS
jgi:hypothetical protein